MKFPSGVRLRLGKLSTVGFTWLCALGVCLFFLIDLITPQTFCYSQMRVIPDEEFIQMGLGLNVLKMDYKGTQDSIENYHKNHPKCCRVWRNAERVRRDIFRDGMFTNRVVRVNVIFKLNKEYQRRWSSSLYKYYESQTGFSSCGQVLEQDGDNVTEAQYKK